MFGSKKVVTDLTPSFTTTVTKLPEQIRELRKDLVTLKQDKRKILSYLLGEDEQMSEYASMALKNAKESQCPAYIICMTSRSK